MLLFWFLRSLFILPLVFFSFFFFSKPVNTSREGSGWAVVDAAAQCKCERVLCTGFLCQARNAQPGCEIRRMVVTHCSVRGFYPTSLLYYNTEKNTQVTQTNNSYDDTLQLPVHQKRGQVVTLYKTWLSQVFISDGCSSERLILTNE